MRAVIEMSTVSNITTFKYFTIQYHRYVPPTVLCFGVIGNIFNLIIFNRRNLRKNPCATYFFVLAITNLNNLVPGLVPNYLSDAHSVDFLTASIVFCRLRFWIVHTSLALGSWLIVLACVDRYCISSRHATRRHYSSLKNARISVALATLIASTMYIHALVLFTIEKTPVGPICYAQSGTYRVFYDFLFFATFSFTPPILMVIVGLATFYNIIRARETASPQMPLAVSKNMIHLHKKDRQFLKMLLIQLMFTVAFTLPIAIQKLYATLTQYQLKSASRAEAESFAAQAVRTLTQINSGLSFYL